MKKQKHKTNPHRRPATQADVKRAKRDAVVEAVRMTRIITFSVLLDKYGLTQDDIVEIYERSNKLSDSIMEGRVSIADLACVLREEYGIEI